MEPDDRDTATHARADVPTPPVQVAPARDALPESPTGYQLLRRLGSGGMGDVFLARDVTADRLVALKYLRAHHNPTAIDRFFREVQALARTDHPNIIRVLGHDYYRAVPFFTMEYAAGGTLGSWVSRHGPMDPVEAARVMAGVARALHAAHEAGVLHRDLKPGNILLMRGEGGRAGEEANAGPPAGSDSPPSPHPSSLVPKVSDFGLAKRSDDPDSLTPSTGAIGTPGYMPPEQVSRRFGEIDRRSDVYGLGATLYHLVAGRPPFSGPEQEVFDRVVNAPPERPRALRPDIPPGLDAVVMKCLEKKQADRFATAAALADELERCAAGEAPVTPPLTRWRRARRWARRNRRGLVLAAAAALLAVGLVLAGKLLVSVGGPSPEIIRGPLRAGREVALVGPTGPPLWHERPLGTGAVGVNPPDQTCVFESLGDAFLELAPDPGIDRYRVRFSLRMIQSRDEEMVKAGTPGPVGVYFSRAARGGANGIGVHSFFALTFQDLTPVGLAADVPIKDQSVRLQSVIMPTDPNRNTNPHAVTHVPRELTPVRQRPGRWHVIELDVTPEAVRVRWGLEGQPLVTLADWSAAETAAKYARTQRILDEKAPGTGIVIPAWSPRMPLGVWVRSTAVSIRDVTIQPLPDAP